MTSFPSIDLTRFDLRSLNVDTDKLVGAIRDAAYVTIGFGVLAFQQAQVRRRQIVTSLSERFGTDNATIETLLSVAEKQISATQRRIDRAEQSFDQAVDALEKRLPQPAATVVGQMHDLGKATRQQLRSLVKAVA